jgi:hypothetical protein
VEHHHHINFVGLFAHSLFLNKYHSKKSIIGRSIDCTGPLTEPQTPNIYPVKKCFIRCTVCNCYRLQYKSLKLLACNFKSFGTIYYCSICKYDLLITIHSRKSGPQNTKVGNSTPIKSSGLFEGSVNYKWVPVTSRSPQLWLLIRPDTLKCASSNHIIFTTLQRITTLIAERCKKFQPSICGHFGEGYKPILECNNEIMIFVECAVPPFN